MKPVDKRSKRINKNERHPGESSTDPISESLFACVTTRSSRPFQACHVLATKDPIQTVKGVPCPIARSFLESFGRDLSPEATIKHQDAASSVDNRELASVHSKTTGESLGITNPREQAINDDAFLFEIDNPKNATLTRGHHERYIHLLSSFHTKQGWNNAREREFKRLNSLVKKEQKLYVEALVEFWTTANRRLLVGLTSDPSSVVGSVTTVSTTQRIRAMWKSQWKSWTYGKCRQLISFHTPENLAHDKSRWSVDSFSSDVLYPSQDNHPQPEKLTFPGEGSKIRFPSEIKPTSNTFLRDDDIALDLARKSNAHIVTTTETIEVLFLLRDSRWMLPITIQDDISMLDLPFPQPYQSPRDCSTQALECALNESVYKTTDIQYSYRMLTLPSPTSSGGFKNSKLRVLVRSKRQPCRVRAHVEYFPERGREVLSSYEKALVVLDHVLNQMPKVGHLDPSTGQIVRWEEPSVAHALVGGDDVLNASQKEDVVLHWYRLAQIFQAVSTIGKEGSYLVCLPAKSSTSSNASASVHRAEESSSPVIDLSLELERIGEISIEHDALKRCVRAWEWDDAERAQFTFPLKRRRQHLYDAEKDH